MAKTANTPEAKFTQFNNTDNWVLGYCGEYTFSAKLYDEGSHFGIKNGRVSKLHIKHAASHGGTAVNYDRGWDVKPAAEVKPYYNAIMQLLENAPKRFNVD